MKLSLYAVCVISLLLIAAPSLVSAVEPTQQFNKILLTPFYLPSMTQNVQYTYNVSTVVPDGISQIKSAIVTLDAWINPTRTASITVNNQTCNTPSYVISTTYASAGRGVFTFDCTNAILPNTNNVINISIAGGNIGASTAWLDLTYMNDPVGRLDVHGTEYIGGDVGKLFLQFLDSENQPVTDSTCFVSLWYPNSTNFLNNSVMTKLDNGSDGIYYKNFNVPHVEGVYPASAKCYRPLTLFNTILYGNISDNFDTNTWTGGTGWGVCPIGDLNCQNGWDYEDTVPLASLVSNAGAGTGGCYNASAYCAKFTGSYGFIERGAVPPRDAFAINITYQYKFSGWQNTEAAEFYVFDGNWHLLERHVLTNRSNNVWYTHNEYLTSDAYELESILIGWYADSPSTGDEFFIDAVSIDVIAPNVTISNITDYQILRGSSEVHVSSLYSQLNSSLASINSSLTNSPQAIWNYTNRNLTYYPPTTINNTEVADAVWNYTVRNLTYYPPTTINNTAVADAVWNYTGTPNAGLLSNLASSVWSYIGRYVHGVIN